MTHTHGIRTTHIGGQNMSFTFHEMELEEHLKKVTYRVGWKHTTPSILHHDWLFMWVFP